MQVVGLCRFSYPAIGGFQVHHETPEERAAFLYDPVRLAERFRYFECFTLPALKAQSDPDFTFLIVIGDSLPNTWRRRLEALVVDLPQAVIQAHPPGRHREVMKEASNSVVVKDGRPSLQFRLDDDDAVSVSFVEQLRTIAAGCSGLVDANRHVAFDFLQGYRASPGPGGISACAVTEPFNTAGLAVSVRSRIFQTVMSFNHVKLPSMMPVVTVPGQDMYVRGHSDLNDSRQGASRRDYALLPLTPDQEVHFSDTFEIDADHVRRVFSTG